MRNDQDPREVELTRFFSGFDAGLASFREVRRAYDEHIAFEFNMLQFFTPSETKVSEILAFFLADKGHGQGVTFLRGFIEYFRLADNTSSLLSPDETITVKCEDRTRENRRIDITVFFKKAHFAIGIENKLYAKDQDRQLLDYSKALHDKSGGNYKLLYLTVKGESPSEQSIPKEALDKLLAERKVLIVGYHEIAELLGRYNALCHADNVRVFIRQLQQYIRQQYLGESSMGEADFVLGYIHRHPEILKHADMLCGAVWSVKAECFSAFWKKVDEYLRARGFAMDLTRMAFCESSYVEAVVEHPGSPFEATSDLRKVSVFFEPKRIDPPGYITIRMSADRNTLSQEVRGKVERLEEKMKEKGFGEVQGDVGASWCAPAPLPLIKFEDGMELCDILKDKERRILQDRAIETGMRIVDYIKTAEFLWHEM